MADPPPLDLHITPQRPRTLAGEAVVIDVAHTIRADLDMETVDLNEDRTRVLVTPLDDPTRAEVFSGKDHRALYQPEPLVPIGSHFHAPAGGSWTRYLDLFLYRRPLPAGRYRLQISYRYGATDEEAARSNTVDVEVAPAPTRAITDRWLGGSGPREQLASLWVAADGAEIRWLYRAARPHDPSVVEISTDLEFASSSSSPPVIAHLNDIAPLHFERLVAWLEPGHLGWMSISERAKINNPSALAHGLTPDPPPRLVDPPLHRRDEGLSALVAGIDAATSHPALVLVEAPSDGPPRALSRPLGSSLPEHMVVVWAPSEDRLAGAIYLVEPPDPQGVRAVVRTDLGGADRRELLSTDERVVALVADQWLGQGRVLALLRGDEAFRVLAWDPERPDADAEALGAHRFDAIDAWPASAPDPIDVAALPGALALLFRGGSAWIVATPEGRWALPFAEAPATSTPRLVATPRDGVFLMFPHAAHGFLGRRAEIGG